MESPHDDAPLELRPRLGVQIVDVTIRHSQGKTLLPQMLIPTSFHRKADAAKNPKLK